jgi:Fic family protein
MDRKSEILGVLKGAGRPLQISEISAHFDVTHRTILRDLNELSESGDVVASGTRRNRMYALATVRTSSPTTWDASWLRRYDPNQTYLLSKEVRERLKEVGSPTSELPAGTYARKILDRLLIDLSWSSSRLEGNTYSLLDTEELIESGKSAANRTPAETQMVLNHKLAIEFLVESASEEPVSPLMLRNLHALLSENLLADPADEGRLRLRPVQISGSPFIPLADPLQIREAFELICQKSSEIDDPFEASFFLLIHIPYLQPFIDVNKRVSRLAANIPFVKRNYFPISFLDTDRDAYLRAMLDVYERKDTRALQGIFVESYQHSANKYAVVAQSLGQPDPLRLKYRTPLKEVVSEVVRRHRDENEIANLVQELGLEIEEGDKQDFMRIVGEELRALHEGNYARYRLRPSEFQAWLKR